MRVFVAGGSGAMGRALVPRLVEAGHDVVALTRTPAKEAGLRTAGAEPVVADALDAAGIRAAVRQAEPDVVVHQLTAIPARLNPRSFDRDFAPTNRLRTEGTDHLLSAARAAGAKRVVAQSFAGWPYARTGTTVKGEDDPLDPDPPEGFRAALDAIKHLESAVLAGGDLEGVVLRYGPFYGPGTSISIGGSVVDAVRRRRFPVVGNGGAVWSFAHIDDAARATVAAIEGGHPGIYNIVDDDPAPVREWLPALAAAVGAKPPRRVPAWIGRLAVGAHGVALLTEARGASNAKAKRELDWRPEHASWREGFRTALG
jgi:nucleoside-diphosphate-sugar epimerase